MKYSTNLVAAIGVLVSCVTGFSGPPGENPDNIRMNLVIEGSGTVSTDDVRLLQVPL